MVQVLLLVLIITRHNANIDGDGDGDCNGDSSYAPYTRANTYNIIYYTNPLLRSK